MKNFFSFLLLIMSQFASSQSPTTVEEYNYLVKGYQIQVESGLDMKKGYQLKDIFEDNLGNYKFTLKSLIRQNKNELAATLVMVFSRVSNKTYYLCIPHGNKELLNRYFGEMSTWDRSISLAYAQVISTLYGSLAKSTYPQATR